MKDLWTHERGGLILFALLVAAVVWWIVVQTSAAIACEKRGGEYIDTAAGHICAKIERM